MWACCLSYMIVIESEHCDASTSMKNAAAHPRSGPSLERTWERRLRSGSQTDVRLGFILMAGAQEEHGNRPTLKKRDFFWRWSPSCTQKMESRCVKAFKRLAAAGCCKHMCCSNRGTVVDLPPTCVRHHTRLCGKYSARRIQEGKGHVSQRRGSPG